MKTEAKKCGALLSSDEMNSRDRDNNFTLPQLPYRESALEPYISAKTIQYHYGKHFATYINNMNNQIKGNSFENLSLEEIVIKSDKGLFNNAAQSYNHAFYFESLRPGNANNTPTGKVKEMIDKSFGSVEEFKKQFSEAATTQFGSGWAWVVQDGDNLEIMKTGNAENPLQQGKRAILTIDVWEHAYYLDTQNARAKYVENYWAVIDWDKVNRRID